MIDEFVAELEKEISKQSRLLNEYLNAMEYSKVSAQQQYIYGLGKALIIAQEIRDRQ